MTMPLVLVLGGGNALGSYQAGVCQAIAEHNLEPSWVIGASAGAINGAVIAGNRAEDRLDRLRQLWLPADGADPSLWWAQTAETMRRTLAVQWTLLAGRGQVFAPRSAPAAWWGLPGADEPAALFDTAPLARTLSRLVDFELLNRGTRFCATAVDLATGEDVVFDTARETIGPDHIRASAALLPAFPPVAIGERTFVDPGLSANLPLDVPLREDAGGPFFCLAVDLLPLAARVPRQLSGMAERMQDLVFAAQSRRTIDRWKEVHALQARCADAPRDPVILAHLAYADQGREVVGKALDFSPESARHRWDAGHRDATMVLDRFQAGELQPARPGLTVHHFAFGEPGPA